MVEVLIRIEAVTELDPYLRYHGKGVNQSLDNVFWDTQPQKVIGTKFYSLIHEQIVDLPVGSHYVIYGNSSIESLPWGAHIYVNGELKGDDGVWRGHPVRADFMVTEAYTPGFWEQLHAKWAELEDWQKAAVVASVPAIILGGVGVSRVIKK